MTIKIGDYALVEGRFGYDIGVVNKVTDKTVQFKQLNWRERRVFLTDVKAYSADQAKLQKVLDRLTSASAEATRRVRAANAYEREEHARILQEATA